MIVLASAYALSTSQATAAVTTVTTTITLTSPSPSVYGQPVTLTAMVIGAPGVMPTGTVTFFDGITTDGSTTYTILGSPVAMSGVPASLTTSSLSAGTHTITVEYSGDATYSPSSSTPVTQVVNQASTVTTLSSSLSPSVYGQPVTLTATVAGTPGLTPTGSVTFSDGSSVLGTVPLNAAGQASLSASSLSVGDHTITATYSGNTNYFASTSAAVTQTVDQVSTTVTLTSSVNPSVYGQSVTFTAAVVGSNGGIPTGTVTFSNGSTPLGTSTLNSSGIATLADSSLSAGTNKITASYSGDVNYGASTSNTLQQIIITPTPWPQPVTISMVDMYSHATLTPTPTSLPSPFPSLSDATPTPTQAPTPTVITTPQPTQQTATGDPSVWLILAAIVIVAAAAIGYLFLRRQ